MGSTTNRQSISYPIPSKPKYKYVNITNFKGLSIGDNPLILDVNSASDALNVYVDETNALTTRPRLEKFLDLKNTFSDITKVVTIQPTSFGYIAVIERNRVRYVYLMRYLNNELKFQYVNSSNSVIGYPIKIFEQDGVIYIKSTSVYKKITYTLTSTGTGFSNVVLKDVEPYIPTISVAGTNKVSGDSYESYNILTPEYKRTFIWDGYYDIMKLKKDSSDKLHIIGTDVSTQNIIGVTDLIPLRFIKNNENLLCVADNKLWSYNIEHRSYIEITKKYACDVLYGDCSNDFETVVQYGYKRDFDSLYTNNGFLSINDSYVIAPSNVEYFNIESSPKVNLFNCRCNSDCSIVLAAYNHQDDLGRVSVIQKTLNDANEYVYSVIKTFVLDERNPKINISKEGNVGLVCTSGGYKLLYDLDTSNPKMSDEFIEGVTDTFGNSISPDGSKLAFCHGGSTDTIFYKNTSGTLEKIILDTETASLLNFTNQVTFSTNDVAYSISSINNSYFNIIYFAEDSVICTKIDSWVISDGYLINVVDNKMLLYSDVSKTIQIYTFTNDFAEPNVEIISTLTSADKDYEEYNRLKKAFTSATIMTRFLNEIWFANRNCLYSTTQNNPEYISFGDSSVVGDNDDITGLNVLSESALGIYKKDDVLILSQDSSTGHRYVSENNNVVGNLAVDGVITTVHSNLPIQITKDGIYTIKQQENVSAVDRIAMCISENITDKWLQESEKSVENCKTINRLYWTYLILPTDSNKSKIYLLDNRTLSWYYWEFPIKIENAFVNNNETYFSDGQGCVFVLKTSDLVERYKDSSYTKYCDFDDQIIEWYWQSQILHLGTINYSKKLVNTTFIMTDTDSVDSYSLQYQFKVYRKKMGQTNINNITNSLNYIQSVTKKTFISRFNFLQIKLSNKEDDLDNNKLRLVGLAFKYELLEGML